MDGYAAARPRKLRLQYPGAMYHVMSRGDRRERIFLDDVDRQDFTKTLAEACQKTAWQVQAYCLMPNHYHVRETTLSVKAIAARVHLGTSKSASAKLHSHMRHRSETGAGQAQLGICQS